MASSLRFKLTHGLSTLEYLCVPLESSTTLVRRVLVAKTYGDKTACQEASFEMLATDLICTAPAERLMDEFYKFSNLSSSLSALTSIPSLPAIAAADFYLEECVSRITVLGRS